MRYSARTLLVFILQGCALAPTKIGLYESNTIMLKTLLIIAVLMNGFHLFAQDHSPIAEYIGRKRVLLLFAPDEKDPLLQAELIELKRHILEWNEYDLIHLSMLLNASPLDHPGDRVKATLGDSEQAAARKRFHILPGEFTVLLLGKDGGEKLRSKNPIVFSELAAAIDAMPMRQQELRERGQMHPR